MRTKEAISLGFWVLALAACSGQSMSDISIREVDWSYCQEGYPDNCYDGTAVVWLAPEIKNSDLIEPEVVLSWDLTGHTVAIRSYGCFPTYERPQEIGYYDLTEPVRLEGELGERFSDFWEDRDTLPVEVTDIRPLDEGTVEEIATDAMVPLIAMTSGRCEQENLD